MAETAIWRAHAASGETAATPAENYERWFVPAIGRPFALDLVDAAALRAGERVLDVGCGTGVVARLAAQQVGGTGEVAGLDVNPGMLAVARQVATAEGAAGAPRAAIRWYETAAESMPLPDEAFDVVLCQFTLQFVTDGSAALAEMRRVLAPDGRILVSTPRSSPFFDVLHGALARHASTEAAGFVDAVFSLSDEQHAGALLRTAGFRDVAVRVHRRRLRLPRAAEFLWQYVLSTPLAGQLAALEDERKRALEADVVAGWRPWSDGDALRCEQEIVVVAARR